MSDTDTAATGDPQPERTVRKLRATQVELLGEVAEGNVTWRNDGRGLCFRLWANENVSMPVTARGRRLEDLGFLARWRGYRYDRGGVDLTVAGRAALNAHLPQRGDT